MLGAILGAVAGPVISGIMGNRAAKKERSTAMSDNEKQFERLRTAAERGGFNPLTALQTTGTAGFGSMPSGRLSPLATANLWGQAAGNVADLFTNKVATTAATDRANTELATIQTEQKKGGKMSSVVNDAAPKIPKSARVGGGTQPTLGAPAPTVLHDTQDLGSIRPPRGRPGLWDMGVTNLVSLDGSVVRYPASVASRLKLKNGDVMIAEDFEALYGDELGQAVALPKIPMSVIQNEGGITGARSIPERAQILREPNSVESYFPQLPHLFNGGKTSGSSSRKQGR
jgi:hypothetical protein